MAEVTTRTLAVNGVKSFLRESGRVDSKEAVVFVHGNPGSGEDFDGLLPLVGDFSRAVVPDMPGYGQADRPRGFDYTVEGYADHLDGLISQLGIERVHLALHDFGGAWGVEWASRNPTRVKSLTLFNVGVVPGYTWHKFAKVWRTPLLGELFQATATRGAFRVALQADNPKPFPRAFVDRMYDYQDWGMKRAVLALYRATDDLSTMTQRWGSILRPYHIPTLVLWGDSDKYLPVRFASVQKDYFDAEVHVIPNAGHWPMIDEPELVRDLVIPFLRKHAGAGG
ncbi:MAG TPA: alpha/beta hydrolase [Polyangiaceae bacterium]|nr:alpha/beta hydrolase [Polyangiaceae bacterium]